MEKAFYYANVEVSCVEYFEARLKEREDQIEIVSKTEKVANDGTQFIQYVLLAQEGLIEPEFKLA